MWKWVYFLACGVSLVGASPQNTVVPGTSTAFDPFAASYEAADAFRNICGEELPDTVSCGSFDSREHAGTIEVRVIYWLTAQLPFYKETVQYDVVQDQSTTRTTATRTITNTATRLDMQSHTSLIPASQVSPIGPYCISEVDAVYGTTEKIGTATLTYPTPYALIFDRIHVHQTGRCSNGTNFTTSVWFNQPAPIPLPTTGTAYEELPAEVTFPIPGFNEAFHSLYPALDYCSFSAFMGAPSVKVRATPTQATDIRMMEEEGTSSSSPSSSLSSLSPPPSSSSSPPPPSTTTIAPALSSAASQLTSLASLILCGLGASCPALSSPSGATDSSGRTYFYATDTATQATIGPSNAVPLYTDATGGVVVPLWTTLGQDSAATVGGAVVSVGTGGEVVVDGQTVARGVAAETGGSNLILLPFAARNAWVDYAFHLSNATTLCRRRGVIVVDRVPPSSGMAHFLSILVPQRTCSADRATGSAFRRGISASCGPKMHITAEELLFAG
ncbi:hypothetical protein BFW01_g12831 [Lasiodiplodia theobromae]|nr:hypothetical protein BFW01_g12831 [Lasiodiplodia theobromae]